ncbi:hypothetical protein FRX31_031844 [Thalictrum thalictroides]|uniref:Uncharacterized protein n=1 Tax=Thalictrum thalictroides TaxID=46969 RepID=A0A7J6V2S9_THATH|nr:hypothetical protein FRX31_031844 [Thalictrum thalictroides]
MVEGMKLQKKEPEKKLVPQVFKVDEELMKDVEQAARKVLEANNITIPGKEVLLERCFKLAPPPPNSIRELISKFPTIKVADWFHHCEGDDEPVGMIDLI